MKFNWPTFLYGYLLGVLVVMFNYHHIPVWAYIGLSVLVCLVLVALSTLLESGDD